MRLSGGDAARLLVESRQIRFVEALGGGQCLECGDGRLERRIDPLDQFGDLGARPCLQRFALAGHRKPG